MDQAIPRPPWLGRMPSGVWTALTWCAAGLFALLLLNTTAYRMAPHHHAAFPGVVLRVAGSVVLALAIGWARRRPLPVFGVILAESTASAVLWEKTWPFFLVMNALVCYLAATRPRRTAVAAAVVELVAWACQWLAVDHGQEKLSDFASMLSALAASILIAWLIGNSIRQQREYGSALRAQALTVERLRIARELHDMVAHSIGVIAIQAGAASLVIDTQPASARKALGAIETTSRETLAGLRRMLVSLRHADEDSAQASLGLRPSAAGLEAVDQLAETAADAGVQVEVYWRGQRRPLPPETDVAAFRIIQESVTNAVRHSGTHHCRVSVEYRTEELAIEVLDAGRGPVRAGAAAGAGYGISGMRERVALLNGRFSAGSRPEGGFRVAVRLPA
ncbi:histidine kinase [Streptomyces sp. H10-C2]|uniref:sensor histidine kinase n=1 Tax=unclassified Streptomyces TaxID=2593676 RepID=UPI0024B9F0A1|nr:MULTISPECIES: histidine kinase [unclassified Streptomyces]MDJ0344468.1 histidine kinase [Streptomyces sp. PH10-H1]MDJ0372056.1 histidine kinase [Streptomyces sp. H10-C2]